ncbi:MAG: PAS domain S-box protein [Thermodesulfobacteriota bacterium]
MSQLSLPQSEAVFRRLADNFPGLAWVVSLEQQQPRLVYTNPASPPLWEWCRKIIQENFQKLLALIHPEDVADLKAAWTRLLQGEQVSGEFRLLGPDGEVHAVQGQAFPLEDDSPPRLVAGFCQAAAVRPVPPQGDSLAWEAQVNAALAEVSQAVIKPTPPQELSRLVLTKAKELTGSEWSSVAYLDQHTRQMVFPDLEEELAENSLSPTWNRERWALSGRWARCLAERQALILNEPPQEVSREEPDPEHLRFLCVPAAFRDKLLGQVALATNRRDYEERDLAAVQRLASLFAIALERRQADEDLRESEERFRSLVEATSDLVWETDAVGRLTYISPNVHDLLGYSPEEILGKTFLELLTPEEASRMGELLGPILERHKPYVFVGKTSHHKCGRPVVLESSGVPVLDTRGNFLGYRGLDRDITVRQRAAETLYREKEKYRTLVEEAPLGVAIIGADGTYKYINPMFKQMFGYTLDDVPTGRDWFARAYPDEALRREVIANWLEDLQTAQIGEARPRTFPVTCKDGSQKIVNFRSVTLMTGDQLVIYEDVTDRQRAEAALRESERKYRLLVSNIPAVVFRGYADWSVEVFDDKIEELTGYSQEEFNSGRLKWADLILAEDVDECQNIFREAMKGTGAYVRQYRIRHKQGHILWIQARGQIIRDPQSRIDHVYGVFFDITKQREIEEALRESEEHLKTIMDSIRAGVVMIEAESRRIVDVNHYAGEMIGLSRDQLLERDCRGLFCIEEMDGCPVLSPSLLPMETECCLTTSQNQAIPILKTAATIKRGGRTYILLSFLDLTGQKKVEKDLAAEKERLGVTLRSIGDGVIATDTRGKVVLMNQVAEDLTGWTQEEARGLPVAKIFRLVHEVTRKTCDTRVNKVIRTGKVVSLPTHIILQARDGAEYLLAASAAPIVDQQSQVIGVVLVFQDVTQKRQTEAELQKMEKLTSLGILAGGIAHDFNNILTGILGNISLAMISTPQRGEIFRRLAEAEQATLRARDLVQQLLTFAKGGAPVKEVTSLGEIIRDSATFACRGSQVRCDITFLQDLWHVEVDPGQISQVIQNLAINAIQAMPTGGAITIQAKNVLLEEDGGLPLPPGKYVEIQVKDQGMGIPADYLPKIFDPYFSTKQKGSGLGLATAYSIIKNHEGYMTVESTLGEGTTFFIYLPASAQKIVSDQKELACRFHQGRGRILVMDDDAGVRQVAGKMLSHLGYEVDFAADGAEAIEKYQGALSDGQSFDLVIMDLTIPGGMGGEEALQALLKIEPRTRAIVSSGYADDPIMTRYKEYGFSGVIKKPYRVSTFSQVLQEVLEQEQL